MKQEEIINRVMERVLAKLDDPNSFENFRIVTPSNYISKRAYQGFNHLLLSMVSFYDKREFPYYLTFKQCSDLNGLVKKGEHGYPIVFWKLLETKNVDDNGNKKKIPFMTHSTVFNIDQCSGIPRPETKPLGISEQEAWNKLHAFCNAENLQVVKMNGTKPCYIPIHDTINVPSVLTTEGILQTFAHEIIHATGHEKRLNRFGVTARSKEELIAELGGALLLSSLGYEYNAGRTASYIKYWVGQISDNREEQKKELWDGIRESGKAIQYILNRLNSDTAEDES